METIKEVILVSETGSKDAKCIMYDFHFAKPLETYKDSHSGRHGMDVIGDDYLISAFETKIKIWQFGQPNVVLHKTNSPGIVSALAVTKSGRYCIAGIGKTTFVWEVATGNLQACLEYHVQDITCVRFSSDGSHFITGGKDGMVFVFLLTDVITQRGPINTPKAHFTWTHHSAEITDIHVGQMSFYSRVATASIDRTCRIYELDTGYHLCTIHVNAPLTAVTMDICEYFLYLGSQEGNLYRISLYDMDESEMHFDDIEKTNVVAAHTKEITSLSVAPSGRHIVTGSADKECKVWDITNFTCVRRIAVSGPITKVMVLAVPPGVKNKKYEPRLFTSNLKRVDEEDADVPLRITDHKLSLFHAGAPDQFFDSKVLNLSTETLEKTVMRGSLTLHDLSCINNEMYSFALSDIFDKATTEG